MSKDRHRGQLFDAQNKRKPSQADMEGEGRIAGKPYALSAWRRGGKLVLSVVPPRERGSNTYPPEAFRGELNPAKGRPDANAPVWTGDINGDEGTYAVRAYQRQGKSGPFLSLELDVEPT